MASEILPAAQAVAQAMLDLGLSDKLSKLILERLYLHGERHGFQEGGRVGAEAYERAVRKAVKP